MDDADRRVQVIHNPLLAGPALLLVPEGILVRWPPRVPAPAVGGEFSGTAVRVPPLLLETVLAVLFDASPIARCDAAQRLATRKQRALLNQLFSRTYVQKMLACAERMSPELRDHFMAEGDTSIRALFVLTNTLKPE